MNFPLKAKFSGAGFQRPAVRGLVVVVIALAIVFWEWTRVGRITVVKNDRTSSVVVNAGIECFGTNPEIIPASRGSSLVDISEVSGLAFEHAVGPLGTYFMPESVGTGAACFDYDGDGNLDFFFVQSARTPGTSPETTLDASFQSRLYRQISPGVFEDQTEFAGLQGGGYGCGCAVGDIDNDGDQDLYVTKYAQDSLYLNNADGTFTEVTDSCGIQEQEWGTCAAFFDFNRDGLLDLFVVNYTADPTYQHSIACGFREGLASYCGPHKFQPTIDRLYRNDGVQTDAQGRKTVQFTDVTETAGIGGVKTFGFGVVCADFTGDGWPDIFVANDGAANRLWINHQNGTFTEEAIQRGCAMNKEGGAEAGMGVAFGDVNRDGMLDLVVTHLSGEKATLYLATEPGYFEDASATSGTTAATKRHTGWGAGLIDFNHDGYLDLPVTNGLVIPCHSRFPPHGEDQFQVRHDRIDDPAAYWRDYADQNLLLMGQPDATFRDATHEGGDFCAAVASGRALVHGDIDNDGDIDLLITNCGGKGRLYRNDFPKRGSWLMIRAIDPRWKRDANLAEITLHANGREFFGIVNPASSFLASNDFRVHFGLGECEQYDRITIKWPDGPVESATETFAGGPTNRTITLQRGLGQAFQGTP